MAFILKKNGKYLSHILCEPMKFEADGVRHSYVYVNDELAQATAKHQGAELVEVYKTNAPFGDWEIKPATFNLLDQSHYVKNLLNCAVFILPQLVDSEEKENLINAIKVFESTVVVTTWGDEDIISRADDCDTDIPAEKIPDILNYMVNSYECHDHDWGFIDTCIETICEE